MYLQPPLPERKDHVGEHEGDTKSAPIVDIKVVPAVGGNIQRNEDASMHMACPSVKSAEPLAGGRLLIETLNGLKSIVSESQLVGKVGAYLDQPMRPVENNLLNLANIRPFG